MPASGSPSERPPITQVLHRLAEGEAGAADQLLPLVYDELRQLAKSRMAQVAAGQTLQATALVHEAWMRLGTGEAARFDDRAHFFGAAARAMRFILVEQARRRGSAMRGGGQQREPLHADIAAPPSASDLDLEALDLALSRLEESHPRHARLVTLRYFGGLGMAEIATMLDVPLRTAERDWQFARSWLRRDMESRGGEN